MRNTWRVVVAGLLLFGVGPAGAEEGTPAGGGAAAIEVADLGEILAPLRERHGVPALGGAVVSAEAQGVVAVGAVGLRAMGSPESVTPDDVWHIGSCTKSMTATLAARLVERGRLRFDATLGDLFPDVEIHEGFQGATLRHLLAHRAGLGKAYPREVWSWAWTTEDSGRAQRVRGAAAVLGRPPEYAVGSRKLYSNVGFDLAGGAMERLEDRDYGDLLRDLVFVPLEMTSAGLGPPGSADVVDQPRGHRERGGALVAVPPGRGADNPPILSPAGRVHLTLRDWGRYVAMHLREEAGTAVAGEERPFLSAAMLRRLHTPEAGEDYAYGWSFTERPWAKGRVLTHNGSNTMWFAVCWLAPERGFAVLAVCNRGGDVAAKACDETAGALIRWHQAR